MDLRLDSATIRLLSAFRRITYVVMREKERERESRESKPWKVDLCWLPRSTLYIFAVLIRRYTKDHKNLYMAILYVT